MSEALKNNEVNNQEAEEKKPGKKGRVIKIVVIAAVALILAGAGAYAVGKVGYERGQQDAQLKSSLANHVAQHNNQHNGNGNGQAIGQSNAAADIGIDKAKAIALAQVSGAAQKDIVRAHSEYEDGRLEYEIDIKYDGYEYDFKVDASTGQIIESDTERAEWF